VSAEVIFGFNEDAAALVMLGEIDPWLLDACRKRPEARFEARMTPITRCEIASIMMSCKVLVGNEL
jgi:hypothetical protein